MMVLPLLAMVALLTAPPLSAARAAGDMQFSLSAIGAAAQCGAGCAKVIVADGEITNGTPAAFIDFLKTHARDRQVRTVVFINSPGGKVHAAMALGKTLRAVGAAVVVARPLGDGASFVPAACYSACVYALMGGVKRVAPAGSRLGVHRMYMFESGPDPTGSGAARRTFDQGTMRETLARYARAMGVAREAIDDAESTPSDGLLVISPQNAARWRLASPTF